MKILTHENEEIKLELINTEKATSKSIEKIKVFKQTAAELRGAKLIHIEPILNGLDCDDVNGIELYFELPDGTQRVIEVCPGEYEPDKLYMSLYQ